MRNEFNAIESITLKKQKKREMVASVNHVFLKKNIVFEDVKGKLLDPEVAFALLNKTFKIPKDFEQKIVHPPPIGKSHSKLFDEYLLTPEWTRWIYIHILTTNGTASALRWVKTIVG